MNIIMGLTYNGTRYVSYESRLKELVWTEKLEDEEERFPIVDILFGPLLSIIALRLLQVKVMQLFRRVEP